MSHFVWEEPSTRFSLTSPPPEFSPLARMATTLSVWLPGMPLRFGPLTPEAFLRPFLSVSTVFVQVGCGSPASKEDEKSPGPAWAAAGANAATTPRQADTDNSLRSGPALISNASTR